MFGNYQSAEKSKYATEYFWGSNKQQTATMHQSIDDWLSKVFASHSTQNWSFRRRFSPANLLAWYWKKINPAQKNQATQE